MFSQFKRDNRKRFGQAPIAAIIVPNFIPPLNDDSDNDSENKDDKSAILGKGKLGYMILQK